MKTLTIKVAAILACSIALTPLSSFAAGIINGDFQTGDYSGWSQDVDGFGAPTGGGNDFSIVEPTTGNSVARIESDYVNLFGDLDENRFSATLFQGLDLSVSAGQELVLSFDWVFDGEASSTDEALFFGLGDGTGDYYGADGNLGFLLEEYTYGSDTFSTTLDDSFLNATGWTIEFQVARGSSFDDAGSYALIDNVAIEAVTTASNTVPEPSVLWLMSFGLLGLLGPAKKKSA
jgi:hypothetical protein